MPDSPSSSRVEIMLVRHGRPQFGAGVWSTPREVADWIRRYNEAGIGDEALPPAALAAAQRAAVILSSPRPRCTQSAARLAGGRVVTTDELYREADLPHLSWRRPTLPVAVWAVGFRLAWFAGFSRDVESLYEARARARQAARQLIATARESGSVLLVGHGVMNALIATQLLSLGVTGTRLGHAPFGYAATLRLSYATPNPLIDRV